ncbi:MAG: hypothetical protein JKY08_06170 [Flavobacteriaceae bacterium]|nr:hypothetical protein [Flavobacteriaceae bacterium]
MNEVNLEEAFKDKLALFYGDFKPIISKFGISSFGKIASDLCISSSQFSKLISGTATQGMYIRSIRNVAQLSTHKTVFKGVKQLKKESKQLKKELHKVKSKRRLVLMLLLITLVTGLCIGYFLPENNRAVAVTNSENTAHPLYPFFNAMEATSTDLGFLKEEEVQEYCPSSAFEGTWKLAKPYKIPLPGSKKPGVYLLAKTADITLVTSKFTENKGQVLMGFEYLTHEIWVDTARNSLIPRYFDPLKKEFTMEYEQLVFENSPNFVKIAVLKSFYIDEFTITPEVIIRNGQPSGRYIDFIAEELAKKYEIDVAYILNEVISNLTETNCNDAVNEYTNPNDLKVNSTLSFDCIYSIDMENLGLGGGYPYTKTIQLVSQNYADNLMCRGGEEGKGLSEKGWKRGVEKRVGKRGKGKGLSEKGKAKSEKRGF